MGLGILVVGGLMLLGVGVDRLRTMSPAGRWARPRAITYVVLGSAVSLAAGVAIIWWWPWS
jgi:hypothetical protein